MCKRQQNIHKLGAFKVTRRRLHRYIHKNEIYFLKFQLGHIYVENITKIAHLMEFKQRK